MKVTFNARFVEQRKKFNFRFTCEYCMYFDPPRDQCLHEYPNDMHLETAYIAESNPEHIVFCKQFELK